MPRVSYVASGTIQPNRFVTLDGSGDQTVTQSTTGDKPQGISVSWSANSPIPGATSEVANAGDQVAAYDVDEDICFLLSGTAGWTAGNRLGPDASGRGINITSGHFGAVALETVTGTVLGKVQIQRGTL